MKKKLLIFGMILLCAGMMSCGSKKETAASIAQKWCDLNGKVHKATDDAEKQKAKTALNEYENKMEEKYKNDEAFMKQIRDESEKCEDASEGR